MNIITEGKLKAGAAFVKLARQYGAKLVRSKKHNVFRDAAGHQITAPKTTSDFRAIKNFEAELKGRGFTKQDTVSKVKDALVKGSKETALPASRKTANQQTTFKQFTQRFQPNVQGPRKPNSPVVQKQGRVQGPESELAHRHKKAFDNRLDELIKSVRGRTVAKSERKKITRAQLDAMKISQKEKDKLVKQGLVEDNKHRDAKLNYQYKQVTDPKRPVDPIKLLKLKKGTV